MKLENKHTSSPKSALLGLELTVTVHHDDPETFTLPPPTKKRNHHHTANPRNHSKGQIRGGWGSDGKLGRGSGMCLHDSTWLSTRPGRASTSAPSHLGVRGARVIVVFFFGDLLTLNLQRAARAVRSVTKETGGGCTLAPMSQSRVLIL